MRKFCLLTALCSLFLFTGCPDYSHLRSEPDYKNMSDSNSKQQSDVEDTVEEEAD